VLEYSKTIGNLLGNPDSPLDFMIEDPKTILKVSHLYVFFLLFS
jgi:nuclear pore complex protein Nup85